MAWKRTSSLAVTIGWVGFCSCDWVSWVYSRAFGDMFLADGMMAVLQRPYG